MREIAEEEHLTLKQVEEIVYSFFRFTAKSIGKGNRKNMDFKTIRLFKFGTFRPRPGYVKALDEINKKKGYEKPARNTTRSSANITGSLDDKGVQSNLESGPFDQEG